MPPTSSSVPLARITGLAKVYDPGCHCAFTDLIRWRGRVWLTFREALNHSIHPSSQIVVLASADHGRSFQLQARLAARGLDVRDPHFFVVDDRLHLTIPCWRDPPVSSKEGRRHTIVARSDDGQHWEMFREISLFEGRTAWRPRRNPADGAWYAAAYERDMAADQGRVMLARSTDGLEWSEVSTIEDADFPNETELCFLSGGDLLALVRREKGGVPLLARAAPPYTGPWKKVICDRRLWGPLLEDLGGGRFLVVGRVKSESDPNCCVTRMHALDIKTGTLRPGQALESGGDTSYAGFARLPDEALAGPNGGHNALLSYYSGHGYDNGSYHGGEQAQRCAIYVARMVV